MAPSGAPSWAAEERALRLKAGAELDLLVHERVMGYRRREQGGWETPDGEPCPRCWSYSTSSSWALIVAETLVAPYQADPWLSFSLRTTHHPDRGRRWHAMFRREDDSVWAEGMTPEEAICLAALAAVGYTEAVAAPEAPAVPAQPAAPREWPTRADASWWAWTPPAEREREPVAA